MLLVRRARATFRSAELGFLGVCVYTRIHTPRFSGHPCSAGDFVFVRTFSRPLRTSCANVGTALPHHEQNLIPFPAGCRRHAEFEGLSTERVSSNPGGPTRFSSHRIHCGLHGQRVKRRGLLGFAGLAPHSGRSPRPVPSISIPEQETFPFYHRAKFPLTKR